MEWGDSMKITNIQFAESCCGEHSFVAEYIRADGIGFDIKKNPETQLFTIKVYAADGKTLKETHVDLTEADADLVINT
jgi:hypothetical protein